MPTSLLLDEAQRAKRGGKGGRGVAVFYKLLEHVEHAQFVCVCACVCL